MAKPPGQMYFGEKFRIDEDTIGRERFPQGDVFTNPEFAGAKSPEEILQRDTAR